MSTRTDVHAPVNLVTEDYEYVLSFDNDPPEGRHSSDWEREIVALVHAHDRGTWQCHHCGAHLRYAAILLHAPTGEYIAVGETCLDNRFSQATSDFQALRKQAQLDRQQQRIRKLVDAFIEANPDLAFLGDKHHAHTNGFVSDVARKLRTYGELSEKQVAAIRASIVRDAEYNARKAAEAAAPQAPKVPVLTGSKIAITGEVLKLKWSEDYGFGRTLKMTVLDDRGFKVWGSVPKPLLSTSTWDDEGQKIVPGVKVGDRVSFLASTIEASEQDETFGFFKRPTRATITERKPVEEAAVA